LKILIAFAALGAAAWSAPHIASDKNEAQIDTDFIEQLARKAALRDSIIFVQYRTFVMSSKKEFYPSLEEFKPRLTKDLVRAQDEYDKMYISYLKFRMEMFSGKLNKFYNQEFKKMYKSDSYVSIEHSDLREADGIRQNTYINDYMDSLVSTQRRIAMIHSQNIQLREQYKNSLNGKE